MTNYIDGYVFPIERVHLDKYKKAADAIAKIWKEHGALAYFEYVSDDFKMEGISSFSKLLRTSEDESVVFGWILFESQQVRDMAHEKVAADSRMDDLVRPLMDPSNMIFDAQEMVYGGFASLINVN